MKKIILPFLLFFSVSAIFCSKALDNNDIIAYPSPFNPGKQILSISYPNGVPSPALDSENIEISDINGDVIFHGAYALTSLAFTNPVIWNGRNDAGDFVNAGEYIIKVVVQNTSTGYYSLASIELLVQR